MATVLALSRVSQWLGLVRLDSLMVGADSLVLIPDERFSSFTVIQCRVHEMWARFMGSSMNDRLRYTPTDCFETFPFPEGIGNLNPIGQAYYDFRATLMTENNEGLTRTYNRLHNPEDRSPGIVRLRELHAEMDRAVLDGYGWCDIQPVCDFYPEFDDEDQDDSRQRRKKYRYRWSDEVRDEVLARLLALNAERA